MQDLKRKIGVAAGSIVMLGATMAGAMAANLGGLPAPFIANEQFAGQIVVGASAAVPDVIAAAQIAAAFGQHVVTASSTAGDAVVSGGLQDDVTLGGTVASGLGLSLFKDNKIPYLLDEQITYDGDDYDIHEEIIIGTSSLKAITGVTGGSGMYDVDEYGSTVASKIYLAMEEGDIRYSYVFDDAFNASLIDDPLELEFMGRSISISEITTADRITLTSATEYTMYVGDTVVVDGVTVEITGITSDKARIQVSGASCAVDSEAIEEGDTFDTDCDLQIKVLEGGIWYADVGEAENSVDIEIGEELSESYNNNGAFIGYEDADDSDVAWKWNISVDADGTLNYLGAYLSIDYDSVDDGAFEVGDAFNFWNDYAAMKITGLTDVTMGAFDVKFDEIDVYNDVADSEKYIDGSDTAVSMVITGPDDDTFSTEYERLAIHANATGVYVAQYDADENKWDLAVSNETDTGDWNTTWATGISGEFGDTTIDISVKDALATFGVNLQVILTIGTDDLLFDVTDDTDGLSAFADDSGTEDAEAGDIILDSIEIGAKETDVRSTFGIIVKDPDAGAENDEVAFEVPDEQVYAKVYLGSVSGGTTVSDGSTSMILSGLNAEVAVLDSEASTSTPMVVVGGPFANAIAAQLVSTADAETFFGYDGSTGKGVVKLYDVSETPWSVQAMIVAGWDAKDTRAAAYILSQYVSGAKTLSNLEGKSMITVSASGATTITSEELD